MAHLGSFPQDLPKRTSLYRIAVVCDLEAHCEPLEVAVWELFDWGVIQNFPLIMGGWQLTAGSKSSRVIYNDGRIGDHEYTLDDIDAGARGEFSELHVRYVFRCEECGDSLRRTQKPIRRALDGLRHAGWAEVTISGLRGIL